MRIIITLAVLCATVLAARVDSGMPQAHAEVARPVNLRQANTPTRTPTPISVGNFVWEDLNGNGIQNAGEPGVSGIRVQLWNAAKTALLDSTMTNESGNYTLTAPTPGDYRVRVLLPSSSASFTLKNQGSNDTVDSDFNPSGVDFGFTDVLTFASNLISITTIDGGLRGITPPTPTRTPTPVNIGNFVWHDLSGDGTQQAGEPGVGFVTVQLWDDAKTQLLDSAVSSASGAYQLTAPTPGNYYVRVLLPPGASFTLKNQGDETLDSDINPIGVNAGYTDLVTLASNVISTTVIDAGLLNVAAFTPTATQTSTPTPTPTTTPTTGANLWLPMLNR